MTAAELLRARDWSTTGLGPRSRWPAAVEHVVATVLESPLPLCYQHGPTLDMVYNDAIGALFRGRPDPIEVIKWKELYDTLERAIDRCQTAAIVLESISLKNS